MKNKVNFVWETISLRTKLTALSIALIGILLAVSSIGTIALLRTYLQTNADTLLTSTATTLRDEDPAQLESRLALHQLQLPALPSDFYIAYVDMDGQLLIGLVSSADDSQGVPNLSNFNADFVSSTQGIPFNADSGGNIQDRPSRTSWRMVAVPLTDMPGSLVVALPTASNDALINQYSSIGTGFALALMTLSGFSIWLTISSALKPLAEVERTAKAVADGDISQRLIERPGKTEIARLNRSLNSMLDGIEGALKSRNKTVEQMRRFVSDASHELRTPLVSVRGYAELYRMGALKNKDQIAEAMSRIENEAIRMTGLVESLLTLARLDETTALTKTKVDLVALALDSAKDASAADAQRSISVTDKQGKKLAAKAKFEMLADANELRQVFTNLLANASRFSPATSPIEIAIFEEKARLVVEVRDHGEGIPKELRKKVFERFYRVDNSRNSETGGTGIGLSIVSTIVERHDGTIEALETSGGGATFRFSFPLAS